MVPICYALSVSSEVHAGNAICSVAVLRGGTFKKWSGLESTALLSALMPLSRSGLVTRRMGSWEGWARCPLPSDAGALLPFAFCHGVRQQEIPPSVWPGLPRLQNCKTKSSLQKDSQSWDFCYGSIRWVGRACFCVTTSSNTCEIHLCNTGSGWFSPFAVWGYILSSSMHHHHHQYWLVWRTVPCL